MYNLQRSPSRLLMLLALIAIVAGLMPANTQHGFDRVQARTVDTPLADDADPWTTVLPASVDGMEALESIAEANAHGIDSDDFNSCELDTGVWTFTDPQSSGATASVNGTQLLVTVPPQVDYNLWVGKNYAARVTQDVDNDDFEVVAKFESTLLPVATTGNLNKIQGIIIEGATNEILPTPQKYLEMFRFDFYSKYNSGTGNFEIWVFGAWVREGSAFTILKERIYTRDATDSADNDPAALYLRVTREDVGDIRWTGEYKVDNGGWSAIDYASGVTPDPGDPAGSFRRNLDLDDGDYPGKIGVFAGSTATNPTANPNGAPGHTAVVDYFFETNDPIVPEDGKSNDLTTNAVGNGSITVDPDQATYVCGEDIDFTAVPDSGWEFVEWSGDLSGSTNPKTEEYVLGMDVTATFTQTAPTMYPLTVTTQGSGSVTKSPDAAEYEDGTDVTLTANPDSGHRFVGWSGDETSTNNPLVVTMDGAKSIEAEFEEIPVDTYSLDIQVFPTDGSGGTATKSPDQASYMENDTVVLTAQPMPGYEFQGWTGLMNSASEVVTVTMPAQNSIMLASFVEAEYAVTTQSNGSGSVTVTPVKTAYRYGDQVTIQASAGSGWSFLSWGGDVGGSENPQTITITDDTNIIATFNNDSGEQKIYLPLVSR